MTLRKYVIEREGVKNPHCSYELRVFNGDADMLTRAVGPFLGLIEIVDGSLTDLIPTVNNLREKTEGELDEFNTKEVRYTAFNKWVESLD